MFGKILRWGLGLGLVFVGVVLLLLFVPVSHPPFSYSPPSGASYEEMVAELEAEIAATPDEVRPEGHLKFLLHGKPTRRVFVLMHGLSNCPAQFAQFGQLLFERGHNVLIPRLPYHGEKNRMTDSFAKLTAEEMLEACNRAVNQAQSLGQEVVFVGLSISGTTAAWIAQNRSDLHRSVLLSPFLAAAQLPPWLAAPSARLLLRLPNIFVWWDFDEKEDLPGPNYVYPRFPTRLIGQTIFLGCEVLNESAQTAPRCPDILVVTSESDHAANNQVTAELVENWRRHRKIGIDTHIFPLKEKVPHDFIDPHQPDQVVDLVYPVLLGLLEK